MLLQLAYYGDPILRVQAQEIEQVNDATRKLAQDMIQTMDHHHGTGLAAPQVKHSIRLFVARLSEKENYDEWVKDPVEVFINPRLCEPSQQQLEDLEGCLSIPGIRASVQRPQSIRIQAMDLDGCAIDRVYTGFLARILMHENDHLNGVLYIDRISKSQRQQIQTQLKKICKRYKL